MEALFSTCKQIIADITSSCIASEVYAMECLKLAKYVAKCALVLTEIELYMYEEQSLRGSQSLFLAVDGMVSALKEVHQLMEQLGQAGGGGVWPLEDAVELQAVALELQNAMIGLSKTRIQLPLDVQEDMQHFVRQLGELQFTTSELAEIEELVENSQQRTPRSPATLGPQPWPASPFDRPLGPGAVPLGPIRVASPEGSAAVAWNGGAGPAAVEGGAVEARQEEEPSSPLPDDPFNMDSRLQSSTVRELEALKLTSGQPREASMGVVAEESLLEAQEDNQGIYERGPSPDEKEEALQNLRRLAEAGRALDEETEGDEGEGEEREAADEEGVFRELVEEVVAIMEEGEEEGEGEGEGRGRGASISSDKGAVPALAAAALAVEAQQAQQAQQQEGGVQETGAGAGLAAAGGVAANGSGGRVEPSKSSEGLAAVVAEGLGLTQ